VEGFVREFKFRARILDSKDTKELIYFTLHEVDNYYPDDNTFYVKGIPCSIGSEEQYTGLKDKNGVEIYEGDILSFVPVGHRKFNNPFRPFTMQWDEKKAGFIDYSPKEDCEVIGNIYEGMK